MSVPKQTSQRETEEAHTVLNQGLATLEVKSAWRGKSGGGSLFCLPFEDCDNTDLSGDRSGGGWGCRMREGTPRIFLPGPRVPKALLKEIGRQWRRVDEAGAEETQGMLGDESTRQERPWEGCRPS